MHDQSFLHKPVARVSSVLPAAVMGGLGEHNLAPDPLYVCIR
jgi:hypothetical protein